MITDLIVGAFLAGIGTLLSFLPATDDPAGITAGTSSAAASFGAAANGFFPVSVALVVVGALLALELALLAWDFIVWVYHQFWGSS